MDPEKRQSLPLTGDEFSTYLAHHESQLTVGEIDRLSEELPAVRDELTKLEHGSLHRTYLRFGLLADLVEAFRAGEAKPYPFKTVAEAAVALRYLRRRADLIPDAIPEIGYIDDAAMAEMVFERNADSLKSFASRRGVEWNEVQPE